MLTQFKRDLERESGLGVFLDNKFYPRIATQHERVHEPEAQEAGHDSEVTFDWLSESVTVDEKAQNSDKWLNKTSPTFVLEIFGESWFDENNNPDWNKGWYIRDDIETDYYTFIWLPNVSLFKVITGIDLPFLHYVPADEISIHTDTIAENIFPDTPTPVEPTTDSPHIRKDALHITPTDTTINTFESELEPLPAKIKQHLKNKTDLKYGEWIYSGENIHETKIAIVEKQRIEATLEQCGLTKDVLREKAKQTMIEDDDTIPVDTDKARYVERATGEWSGTHDKENPVFLVVEYDTYHEIADATYHYKNGSWSSGTRLF